MIDNDLVTFLLRLLSLRKILLKHSSMTFCTKSVEGFFFVENKESTIASNL